jgi:putative ABC transport system permease protein
MSLQLIDGRNFSRDITSDEKNAIIVNETLVKEYGWERALGEKLPGNFPPHQVIGVLKDFNFESLHSPVKPLVLALSINPLAGGIENIDGGPVRGLNWYSVRIAGGSIPATLSLLEQTWREIAPNTPFQYNFLDETIGRQYSAEQRMSQIAGYSALLAIFIACMGLFAFSSFIVVQRTKEIGIRKVLGASVSGIVVLVSKDFIKHILIANLIAWPAAYYIMKDWLQDFSYRITIEWWVFILSGVFVLIIAMLTTSIQVVRAGLTNPVESLRYE